MSAKIIVDSTADVTPQVRSRVTVVPLSIRFGDEEYIDRITIDSRTFKKLGINLTCEPCYQTKKLYQK